MDFAASKNMQNPFQFLFLIKAEVALFQKFMFHDNIVQTMKPRDWWKFHKYCVNQDLLEVVDQLLLLLHLHELEEYFHHLVLCIQTLEINSELRKQANWFSYSNYLIRKHWNQSIYWIESLTICK